MPYVQFTFKDQKRYYKLKEERMVIFGREEHTDFQVLNDGLVSREHFGIEKDEKGNWVLIDLGSKNGTLLNDRRLINEILQLQEGDIIKAGNTEFKFVDVIPKKTEHDIFKEVEKSTISGKKDYKSLMHEIVDTIKIKKL